MNHTRSRPGQRDVVACVLTLGAPATTGTLNDSERRRAAAFRHPDDRLRFVLGRTALRALLADAVGGDPAALALEQRPGGPPELPGGGGLHWSVSHGGRLVVVALARRPVGVDVEHRAEATRDWTTAEALLKAGHVGARRRPWRVARLPVDADHVASIAAPGWWRLRMIDPEWW